jgi:molybdenum cofactor cytidylyltransferase
MIVQLLLAAGAGERVGGNKAVRPLAGVPALTRLLDAAAASRVARSIVVLGAEAEAVAPLCARPRVATVLNGDWRRGQTSSLQTALHALPPEADAFLVHPVDHALVGADVLDALAHAFVARSPAAARTAILRPRFDADFGHPVLYAAAYASEFLSLGPDEPGRLVYRRHFARVEAVDVADDLCLLDLDTPEDWALAEARLAGRAEARRRKPRSG